MVKKITLLILMFAIIIVLTTLLKEQIIPPSAKPFLSSQSIPTQVPTVPQKPLPSQKILDNNYHIFQTFNNCGPAALSMALSFYGIHKSQAELGQDLRPYQVTSGDNDDKSVTLKELAEKSKEYDLIPYHRPNGNIVLIKSFITNDIPVITRTWLKESDDIGHFRVVKGFDDTTGNLIQDDSYQGKNLNYLYEQFNILWKKYNYEYLVLVPKDKQEVAKAILKEDLDIKTSWQKALQQAQGMLQENPDDVYARFNLSVALYHLGEYQKSADEYEKISDQLSKRTLWYQIEPIQTYYELGDYQKVFSMTDQILNNGNRAFSELYIIRGNIYKKQRNIPAAKAEFEKAVFYNKNLKEAQDVLQLAE